MRNSKKAIPTLSPVWSPFAKLDEGGNSRAGKIVTGAEDLMDRYWKIKPLSITGLCS